MWSEQHYVSIRVLQVGERTKKRQPETGEVRAAIVTMRDVNQSLLSMMHRGRAIFL